MTLRADGFGDLVDPLLVDHMFQNGKVESDLGTCFQDVRCKMGMLDYDWLKAFRRCFIIKALIGSRR